MSTALAAVPPVEITETGWQPRSPLTYEGWAEHGKRLGMMGRACQWWIGDWLNYGEATYGEKYTDAIEATGLDLGTLMNCASVAGRVEISRRREDLSWSHHSEIASLPPNAQEEWLERAAQDGLTRDRLRAALKTAGRPDTTPAPDTLADFRTDLRIVHHAADQEQAEAWAHKLAARLAHQGVTVNVIVTREAA